MNTVSGRTGSYQSMVTNDQVFDPNGAGLDLNDLGAQGGFSYCATASQIAPRPRVESNSIDFSQSLTQLLSSLGIILMKTLGKDLLLSLLVLILGRT